ncbi:MAG TPA: FAD binding domain-containing protein, partial [Pyrinomonadaceae bacterium]|nr:FAD binding domain-containing protein [Pyrinomonadaceae bacterium]
PAADWPATIIALNAEIVATGRNGERVIRADDFFVDMLTTALEPGEILREIRIAVPQGRTGQAYTKVPHPASGFAVVGVAVNLSLDNTEVCQSASVGITGAAAKAYRARGVETALNGNRIDEALAQTAAAQAADGIDLNGDLYASADYRRHLVQGYTRRAILKAIAQAK